MMSKSMSFSVSVLMSFSKQKEYSPEVLRETRKGNQRTDAPTVFAVST